MKYQVKHNTLFSYQTEVLTAQHLLRLKPRNLDGQQKLIKHDFKVSLAEAEHYELQDFFGNSLYEMRLNHRHEELKIQTASEINVQPRDEILLDLSPSWEQVATLLKVPLSQEQWQAAQFCFASPHVNPKEVGDAFAALFTPGKPLLRVALELTHHIYANYTYQGGVTDIHTPVSQIIAQRQGVCQDFAHLALATLRHYGLAARYVSGYILSQLGDRPTLVGAEASHAWISVFCPELGWIDFDPTNNQMTSDQHIVLAWGRDYADVAPSRGSILGGGLQTLDVDVRVIPLT